MRIDAYRRMDGSVWADFAPKRPRNDRVVLKSYELATRHDMESLIKSPGDHAALRVRALAERALSEHMARNQQPEPEVFLTPTLVQVKDRNFMGRVRWLFLGK